MKLGIAGSGKIVQEFLSISTQLKKTELSAICYTKRSEETGRRLMREYGIPDGFDDYREFLQSDMDTVYVAVPNQLHFQFVKEALEAGKHVIVEKPLTSNYREAQILSELAKKKQLFLFEAVTTLYLPNYRRIKGSLPSLGRIRIVQCNYSQYSSRYEQFLQGEILPAFDPKCSGGALMDINIYNLHYVVGLFGKPKRVAYFPNVERGIDTSGILQLDYGTFQCTCIGAKDCKALAANQIQGEDACLYQDSPANVCSGFEVLKNDGSQAMAGEQDLMHRMIHEFWEFETLIEERQLETCYRFLDHSLIVSELQTEARRQGNIVFPADID